jgi:hypothetical protein
MNRLLNLLNNSTPCGSKAYYVILSTAVLRVICCWIIWENVLTNQSNCVPIPKLVQCLRALLVVCGSVLESPSESQQISIFHFQTNLVLLSLHKLLTF